MNAPKSIVLSIVGCGLVNLVTAAQDDLVHSPSGIKFPAQIEQRFTRGQVDSTKLSSKRISLDYLYADGMRVVLKVYPAPVDARGPTILEGGSRTGATPSFIKDFESLKAALTGGDTTFQVVSENRFQAAPQKKGPIGMKATLRGKKINHDLLLCERNGFCVSFTISYPPAQWIKYSRTYTDVAHFILWPTVK
jgi:hypothetical protein